MSTQTAPIPRTWLKRACRQQSGTFSLTSCSTAVSCAGGTSDSEALPADVAAQLLRAMAAAGDAAELAQLLQLYPDTPNAASRGTGTTALMEAARYGREACVAALLAGGADPNAVTHSGLPALLLASGAGHAGCVEALLQGGADPNAADKLGSTAAHAAVANGDFKCLRALLAGGADPHARDAKGRTPLHCCSTKQPDEALCVQLLLAAGSDPNMPDSEGKTALHRSSGRHGCLETVLLLLAAGADPNAAGADQVAQLCSLPTVLHRLDMTSPARPPLSNRCRETHTAAHRGIL